MHLVDHKHKVGDIEMTPEGYMVAFSRSARTGIQLYKGDEVGKPEMDVVRVLRDEETVFGKETVNRFGIKPITIGHPPGGVSAKDAKAKGVGVTTADVMRDGEYLRVGVQIMDADAVKEVQDGKAELSWGYDVDLEWESGTHPQYGAYDAKQSNIRPNHLAIVDCARAGSKSRLGDSANSGLQHQQWGASPITTLDQEATTVTNRTVTVDGLTITATDQSAQAIEKLQGVIGDLQTTIKAKDGEIADLTKDRDTLKGEKVTLEKQVADSVITPEKLNDMAEKRGKVVKKAKAMMGEEPDSKMKDGEIMRAAVSKHLGDSYTADMSDAVVEAAFTMAKVEDGGSGDPIRSAVMSGTAVQTTDAAAIAANDAEVFARAGVAMKKGA